MKNKTGALGTAIYISHPQYIGKRFCCFLCFMLYRYYASVLSPRAAAISYTTLPSSFFLARKHMQSKQRHNKRNSETKQTKKSRLWVEKDLRLWYSLSADAVLYKPEFVKRAPPSRLSLNQKKASYAIPCVFFIRSKVVFCFHNKK